MSFFCCKEMGESVFWISVFCKFHFLLPQAGALLSPNYVFVHSVDYYPEAPV